MLQAQALAALPLPHPSAAGPAHHHLLQQQHPASAAATAAPQPPSYSSGYTQQPATQQHQYHHNHQSLSPVSAVTSPKLAVPLNTTSHMYSPASSSGMSNSSSCNSKSSPLWLNTAVASAMAAPGGELRSAPAMLFHSHHQQQQVYPYSPVAAIPTPIIPLRTPPPPLHHQIQYPQLNVHPNQRYYIQQPQYHAASNAALSVAAMSSGHSLLIDSQSNYYNNIDSSAVPKYPSPPHPLPTQPAASSVSVGAAGINGANNSGVFSSSSLGGGGAGTSQQQQFQFTAPSRLKRLRESDIDDCPSLSYEDRNRGPPTPWASVNEVIEVFSVSPPQPQSSLPNMSDSLRQYQVSSNSTSASVSSLQASSNLGQRPQIPAAASAPATSSNSADSPSTYFPLFPPQQQQISHYDPLHVSQSQPYSSQQHAQYQPARHHYQQQQQYQPQYQTFQQPLLQPNHQPSYNPSGLYHYATPSSSGAPNSSSIAPSSSTAGLKICTSIAVPQSALHQPQHAQLQHYQNIVPSPYTARTPLTPVTTVSDFRGGYHADEFTRSAAPKPGDSIYNTHGFDFAFPPHSPYQQISTPTLPMISASSSTASKSSVPSTNSAPNSNPTTPTQHMPPAMNTRSAQMQNRYVQQQPKPFYQPVITARRHEVVDLTKAATPEAQLQPYVDETGPIPKKRRKDERGGAVNVLPTTVSQALPPVQQRKIAPAPATGSVAAVAGVPVAPAVSKTQPQAPETHPSCDDPDGHYIININDDLTSRFKILRLLGQGTFGKVIEAYDRVKRTKVAIKIIRAVPKYRDASKVEIRVLKHLRANDPQNLKRCIHLVEAFDYKNHVCMVFELLAQSVFDFLKENSFSPFPFHQIQSFARQLIEAVAFLHDLGLIHTDLKPENLMLENNGVKMVNAPPSAKSGRPSTVRELCHSRIRLIDFGSAIFSGDYHSSVVSTRHYRAPEIILSQGWSFPCDMWSIGCILVEFMTGDALFQTHDNLEHLAMMEVVLGKIPDAMIRNCAYSMDKSVQRFFRGMRLDWPLPETTRASKKYVRSLKPLHAIVAADPTGQFYDLVRRLLTYNPHERITAKQALLHPFLHCHISKE